VAFKYLNKYVKKFNIISTENQRQNAELEVHGPNWEKKAVLTPENNRVLRLYLKALLKAISD